VALRPSSRIAAFLLVTLVAAGPRAAADTFTKCDEAVAAAADAYPSYRCYYVVGVKDAVLAEAALRLERFERARQGGGWPSLVRGHIAWARLEPPAVVGELYRRAADRFAADTEGLGEVIARDNLWHVLLKQGDRAGADAQVARALQVADASKDPEVRARAAVLHASHLTEFGKDLSVAHRALRRAEANAFPDGDPGLQLSILKQLALLSFHMGRYDEAITATERLIEHHQQWGSFAVIPSLRFNIVNSRSAQAEEHPVAGVREELTEQTEAVLQLAEEQGDVTAAARSHALLADLLNQVDPEQAAKHRSLCLQAARTLDDHFPEMTCLLSIARHAAPASPREARRALALAANIAQATKNEVNAAYVWKTRLRCAWDIWPPREAAEESRLALGAIEQLSFSAGDPKARIAVAANWTENYYVAAGRMLRSESPDLTAVFRASERMRARVLLEALDSAGITAGDVAAEHSDELGEARARIAVAIRRLLDPGLAGPVRAALLRELEDLELDEEGSHAEVGKGGRGAASASIATLEQVQGLLKPDETMLVFLSGVDADLYGSFGGGSWVLAITASRTLARRIPDRLHLESMVPIFTGLLARRDGSEGNVAEALYRELLGEVTDFLGPEVRRLVIVPDGALHDLPFEALRASKDSAALGASLEIAVAPSASIWAKWRSRGDEPLTAAALILADPDLPAGFAQSHERVGSLAMGLRLGRLPYARLEGLRVRQAIGGASQLLAGPDATETGLKAAVLSRFGILHFAAHAVADEGYPDRSGVVLNPGSDTEDGLLLPREAAALRLDAHVVVLSACQTAAGPIARGEGMLSLARAFFQGGARTVVASRWRLRDDEAEKMFRWFYGHLSSGKTVGVALRLTRAQAISEGMPAATWAGIVLLGDPTASMRVMHATSWQRPSALAFLGAILVIGFLIYGALRVFPRK
jgi:CHAT domain-containing protein/tetratricopeptide (TPR) repeat protein